MLALIAALVAPWAQSPHFAHLTLGGGREVAYAVEGAGTPARVLVLRVTDHRTGRSSVSRIDFLGSSPPFVGVLRWPTERHPFVVIIEAADATPTTVSVRAVKGTELREIWLASCLEAWVYRRNAGGPWLMIRVAAQEHGLRYVRPVRDTVIECWAMVHGRMRLQRLAVQAEGKRRFKLLPKAWVR